MYNIPVVSQPERLRSCLICGGIVLVLCRFSLLKEDFPCCQNTVVQLMTLVGGADYSPGRTRTCNYMY